MSEILFTGCCTALVTPFLEDKINYPMLEQLLRRQVDAGIEAVVIAGTTGEAPTLSDEEKLELFKRAKKYVGNSCKIIGGTGSNSTARTVDLSKAAEETGIDGLLIVSPYYNKATSLGLFSHYMAVAHAVSLPIILYNVPSRTGVDIPVTIYKRLSKLPNIVGIKEASTDMTKITKILNACGRDLCLWSGNDDLITPVMSLGGLGVISVLSNVLPVETQALSKAALNGDFDTAAALQLQMQPLIEALFSEVNPIPVKEAMKIIGFDCGPCRLPLTRVSEETQKKLQSILN